MKGPYSRTKQVGMVLYCAAIWVSCQQQAGDKPESLIPLEEMSQIQTDVHLAEASIMTYRSAERDSMARLFYGHIFRIHGISEEGYYQSLEYYSQQPQLMKEIYESTEDNLKKLEEGAKGE